MLDDGSRMAKQLVIVPVASVGDINFCATRIAAVVDESIFGGSKAAMLLNWITSLMVQKIRYDSASEYLR